MTYADHFRNLKSHRDKIAGISLLPWTQRGMDLVDSLYVFHCAPVQRDARSGTVFLTSTDPSVARAGAPVNCWGKFRVPFGEVVSIKRKITTMELMQSQERNEILEDVILELTYSKFAWFDPQLPSWPELRHEDSLGKTGRLPRPGPCRWG
jgi:hypothetical protein